MDSKYKIDPIHLDVAYQSPNQVRVEVKNHSQEIITTLFITRPRKHQILLQLKGLQNGYYLLKKVPTQEQVDPSKCFATSESLRAKPNVSLCFNSAQVYLKLIDLAQMLTISGSLFRNEAPVVFEPPQEFSLGDSIREALHKNYDSRISLEHILQARASAIAAWLNLLPHLTTNLIWNAPLPTYVSVVATLQGLTPFLLPTWWMEGKIANLNSKVERDAHSILQADLASNIEQLFYSFERDSKIMSAYQRVSLLTAGHEELHRWVQSLQDGLDRVLKEDQYAISLALGKHNPEAIEKISIGEELQTAEQASPVDRAELADWAHHRSFELDQLDYLIQISKIKKLELFFTWLDPSGDQKNSLGLNLVGQVPLAKSQIHELEIKREQLKSIIYRNSYLLALEYNAALDLCKKGKSREEIETNFNQLISDLAEVNSPATSESLKKVIQGYLGDIAQYENQLAAFRVARAKKDRLILEGYFEELMPQLPSLNFPIDQAVQKG